MTKEEALAKIKELEEYVKGLDNPVGFKNDKVFLLSIEEYERYKERIPLVKCTWWLRSPGDVFYHAALVHGGGSVNYHGSSIDVVYGGVRPALKYKNLELNKSITPNCIMWRDIKWHIIDEENKIAIAAMPIDFRLFSEIQAFEHNPNDYLTSDIREYLMELEDGV